MKERLGPALPVSALVAVLLLAACGDDSHPTPTPTATAPPAAKSNSLAGVAGIVDPNNLGWPREVEGINGRVVIPEKPQRIITVSVGHDEITLALVPAGRLVAVGAPTKNVLYSNVAALVPDFPEVSSDPEVILAQRPNVVVTSPFLKAETVAVLTRVGVPVVQTELGAGPEAQIDNILLMGYIFGEEERAIAFAEEIRVRWAAIKSIASAKPEGERLRVLSLTSYSDKIYTGGADSTEGSIIEAAGAINAAAEAGLTGNPTISLESVIAMSPDLIIIPQPLDGAEEFKQALLNAAALKGVPAIETGRVLPVESKHYTTLSFWNMLGVEYLAQTLWPNDFAGVSFGEFSLP